MEEMDEDGDAAQVEVLEVAVSEGEESMELKEYAVVGRGSRLVEDREERARVREPLTFVDELYALFCRDEGGGSRNASRGNGYRTKMNG